MRKDQGTGTRAGAGAGAGAETGAEEIAGAGSDFMKNLMI